MTRPGERSLKGASARSVHRQRIGAGERDDRDGALASPPESNLGMDRSRSARPPGGLRPGGHPSPPSRAAPGRSAYTRAVIFRLPREIAFPDPALAEPDGLLAVGGDLSADRLLAAYADGIFPWFGEDTPILWWSPDPRLVLFPGELHVPASLKRTLRRGRYRISADEAFGEVIRRCAHTARPGQDGTWITRDMIAAYERLHRLGYAHSFEAWEGDELAGGLYGVSLGASFFGESMFTVRPDASKAAFVRSIEILSGWQVDLVDCQVRTEHLLRFGAREIPRAEFLRRLEAALGRPTRRGSWTIDG